LKGIHTVLPLKGSIEENIVVLRATETMKFIFIQSLIVDYPFREASRIQGIPDSYVLSTSGKLSKKFKMIGNGVPMPLGYNVAISIKNFLAGSNLNETLNKWKLVKRKEKPGDVENPF